MSTAYGRVSAIRMWRFHRSHRPSSKENSQNKAKRIGIAPHELISVREFGWSLLINGAVAHFFKTASRRRMMMPRSHSLRRENQRDLGRSSWITGNPPRLTALDQNAEPKGCGAIVVAKYRNNNASSSRARRGMERTRLAIRALGRSKSPVKCDLRSGR